LERRGKGKTLVDILEVDMTTKEVDQKAVVHETKSVAGRHGPQFILKLRGKKVIIRLISGGQPVTGTIEGYNPNEILIQTAKGQLLVFKHAIATIEIVDEPKGYRADI
jgi:sRNA-binding regulator protein Hfq